MFLKTVHVKNFRSLQNVRVDLDESTVLMGENNAGKTSFMDAIRIALNRVNGRYAFEDYDYYMDGNILSPKDSDGIQIILIFQERIEGEWQGYIMDNLGEAVQFIDGEPDLGVIILKVSSVYNQATNEFESKGSFLNNRFEEIAGRVQAKLSTFYNLCPVFYLQALRNIKDTFSNRSPMWGRFLKKANIPQEKLVDLQESIKALNKEIIDNDINLTKLVEALEDVQKVLDFQGDDLVEINALPMKAWDLLSKAQVVLNNVNQVSFPLERHGQGTQSVTTILLFKAYIDILLTELNTANAEAILMIEEPEAHLHPQATQAIEKVIRELKCQKILTTHSPYFLQNINLLNVRLFKKVNGKTEVIKIIEKISIPLAEISESLRRMAPHYDKILELNEEKKKLVIHRPISQQTARALKGCCKEDGLDNYILKSQDIFTIEELNNLNMYVQRTRGEILFARKWVLYEGQTEEVIIHFCAEKLGYNFEEYGISGIFYRTNGSAGAFAKLARVLGIEWVLLGDRDLQGQKTISELENCGYSREELAQRVFLTNEEDIEKEFVKNGFLTDYENIVSDNISDDVKKLKEDGKDNEYKEAIISIVQAGKVEYAYKLIGAWKTRDMQKEEIPDFIKRFIEEVCKNE